MHNDFVIFNTQTAYLYERKKAMLTAIKRSLNNKTLKEKYEVLKELEKGASNKSVAAMYKIPKNTLSTWFKNKQKIFDGFIAGGNAKRKKARGANHKIVDKAIF